VSHTDVEPLLRRDTKGVLEAKLVLELLRTRYPEQFHPGQARTLQRRFRDWRAQHGPEPEVQRVGGQWTERPPRMAQPSEGSPK
jgi:hypothetical protein